MNTLRVETIASSKPRHNLNEIIGGSKFVQFYVDENGVDEPYLRVGSDNEFHINIFEKFIKEFGFFFNYVQGESKKIISPIGEGYMAVGMGYMHVSNNNEISMCSNIGSRDYPGLELNILHLIQMQDRGFLPEVRIYHG